MSTHNLYFGGEIRKISFYFSWKKCLIWSIEISTLSGDKYLEILAVIALSQSS